MKIRVKFVPPLSDLIDREEDIIELFEGASVRDVLNLLVMKYGKKFKEYVLDSEAQEIQPYIQVMVNASNISSLHGLKTKLKDGDVIRIFPPICGG